MTHGHEKEVFLTTLLEANQILSGLSVMIITIIIHIYIIRNRNKIKKDICRHKAFSVGI